MSLREYKPGTAFPGVVGRTIEESSPARPERVRAKPGGAERALHRPRRHGPDVANGQGAPGRAQLDINRKLVREADFPRTVPLVIGICEGLTCGRDAGSPVSRVYQPPFEFSGGVLRQVVDVSGEPIEDRETQARAVMAHQ